MPRGWAGLRCLRCMDTGWVEGGKLCTFMGCEKGKQMAKDLVVRNIEASFACPQRKGAKQFEGMRVMNDEGKEFGTVVEAKWSDGFLDVTIEMDEPISLLEVQTVQAQIDARFKGR